MGVAVGIDETRLMKVARRRSEDRIGMVLNDLKKLLEEATEWLRKKIKRLF